MERSRPDGFTCSGGLPSGAGSATPFQLSDAGASVCALCDIAHRSDAGTGVTPASASVCLFTQIAAASHPIVGYGGDRCVRCGQVATVIISTGGHYGLCTSRTGGDSYHFDRRALRALQFRSNAFWHRTGARTIENISRIRMDVARASGMDLASSSKQNTFLIEKTSIWGGNSALGGGVSFGLRPKKIFF